jgi:predicted regulator of Ras-like GTPase activity (Roadblock/LC7/MglB family)
MLYGNANLQSAYRFKLREVISEMKEGGDIEGAVLINENNDIIVSAFSKGADLTLENHEIMSLIEALKDPELGKTQDVFFTQRIFDYKGLKILAKRIKDKLTLLVILKKPGYISLAMLDIENSTRKIHEILFGYRFQKTPN